MVQTEFSFADDEERQDILDYAAYHGLTAEMFDEVLDVVNEIIAARRVIFIHDDDLKFEFFQRDMEQVLRDRFDLVGWVQEFCEDPTVAYVNKGDRCRMECDGLVGIHPALEAFYSTCEGKQHVLFRRAVWDQEGTPHHKRIWRVNLISSREYEERAKYCKYFQNDARKTAAWFQTLRTELAASNTGLINFIDATKLSGFHPWYPGIDPKKLGRPIKIAKTVYDDAIRYGGGVNVSDDISEIPYLTLALKLMLKSGLNVNKNVGRLKAIIRCLYARPLEFDLDRFYAAIVKLGEDGLKGHRNLEHVLAAKYNRKFRRLDGNSDFPILRSDDKKFLITSGKLALRKVSEREIDQSCLEGLDIDIRVEDEAYATVED